MADDKTKRGGSDRKLIALGEAYEVRYWSKKFKVTPAKLKYAVGKVGHSAKKVEAYINLQKHKARDKMLIALSQPYEVRYWSKKFKVTPARLKAAVKAAGHSRKRSAPIWRRRRKSRGLKRHSGHSPPLKGGGRRAQRIRWGSAARRPPTGSPAATILPLQGEE